VSLSVSFPGEVTSTNGDQVSSAVVEWKLRPGVVTAMSASARYTPIPVRARSPVRRSGSPSHHFWLAGIVGGLAYVSRDRSPRPT